MQVSFSSLPEAGRESLANLLVEFNAAILVTP